VDQILAKWRLELFNEPGLASWDRLLSQIEYHAGRSRAATEEQRLAAQVVSEVLEPVVHYNRGIRAAQQGNVGEAETEFAKAAKQTNDAQGREALRDAFRKLTDKDLPLQPISLD
jgi:hypothetical protein